ncbi:AbrB family transcriptional regulator [Candidatus Pelagibacter sp.]|nr:AbrB family transcriptional regulator [Candidatus Pelagibacter sp.]MDC0420188.1 AbrB family transcriptional regulator [Candidatus Pelagibacter sp.]|tara:strand:+ start:186 stop:1259 length:1074 start_codon:yes stop_codon:yes gene_type:complete
MLKAIHFDRENLGQLFTKKFLIVILISIPSAIIADFFNVPLAWMIGPMIVTSLTALNGFQVLMPKIALSSILIILGLHIGNYIDQNLLTQMVNWIWTTVIMFFYIVISILIVSKYLQKFSGYKEKTSIFSSAPGALGPLMILAEYEKSDLSQVATAHLIRLIIIITVFPFIIVNLSPTASLELEKFDYMSQNHWDLVLLIIASLVFIFFFDKFKVPAALLSGTLVASGFLQIFDIASYKLPDASINFCLLILGASVGCRFANKTIKEVSSNSFHGLVATILLVLLGLVAAYIATFFVDTNFLSLILSFCPGGIYEVAVIAIAFDLDPDFVAFHHIIRLLFILFTVPVFLRILKKLKK